VQRNVEVLWRNHCCCGKEIIIQILSVCVFILSYPAFKAHAPYYVLSTLACLAVKYSSTLSHKRHDFLEKKILLNTKYLV